jgi:hypothetical protein
MNRPLEALILTIRNQKVILDADLAEVYGVETRALNQAVKRSAGRFPPDFVFLLSAAELAELKSRIMASHTQQTDFLYSGSLRSQFVTLKKGRGQHRKYPPYAFTEHGALMAANVLSSAEAVKMSVYVVRAFIKQRELLLAHSEVLKKLALIDAKLLKHDAALRGIWRELQPLLCPPAAPPKRQIGFHQT